MSNESFFERWKNRFERGWAIKAQIAKLVQLEVLTEEEYELITGESYEKE